MMLGATGLVTCTHGVPDSFDDQPMAGDSSGGAAQQGGATGEGAHAAGDAGDNSGAGDPATGGAPPSSSGGAAGAQEPSTETYPRACSDVYDADTLQKLELEVEPDVLAAIEQDCAAEQKIYRPAKLRYGDESVEVMVRLKGNWSFRCAKKQFIISFNETDSKARFHGQRKLVLDAPWYDPSLLAERLGFSYKRRAGAFWSCVNHAQLFINGEYYGAYANVERIDKEYVQRHFPKAEAEGNLYQAGVELTTNESVADNSRRDALMAAVSVAEIAELSDLDSILREWATSAMLPDPDSYWAGVEANYYLYDHPERGFVWFPSDMDLTMRQGVMSPSTSSVDVGVQAQFVTADPITYENPDWKRESLYVKVLSEASWCERYLDELRAARDAYDVAAMTRDLEAWATQIAAAVAADPHRPYSVTTHDAGVETLKAFMPRRLEYVNAWLESASCPVTRWP